MATPASTYFGLQHIGGFVAQSWMFQPAVVLTRATACSWLAVLFVEIALLGIVLSDVTGHSVSKTVLMWPLLYVPISILCAKRNSPPHERTRTSKHRWRWSLPFQKKAQLPTLCVLPPQQ